MRPKSKHVPNVNVITLIDLTVYYRLELVYCCPKSNAGNCVPTLRGQFHRSRKCCVYSLLSVFKIPQDQQALYQFLFLQKWCKNGDVIEQYPLSVIHYYCNKFNVSGDSLNLLESCFGHINFDIVSRYG